MRSGLEGDLLRVLRDAGPQTKNQLADVLGVPRTTLNASLRSLTAAGHIEDGPVAASSGGRRSITVRIAGARRFLVVSLSRSTAQVAVLDGHLTIAAGVSIDLHDREPDAGWLAETVRRAGQRVLGDEQPAAVGVAVADTEPEIETAVVEGLASTHHGRPLVTVPAVRAMALGERRASRPDGADDFVAVRLGESVTTATVAGGYLGLGAGGRSGEVGHLRVEEFGPACACGLTGCLDSFVSSGRWWRRPASWSDEAARPSSPTSSRVPARSTSATSSMPVARVIRSWHRSPATWANDWGGSWRGWWRTATPVGWSSVGLWQPWARDSSATCAPPSTDWLPPPSRRASRSPWVARTAGPS